MLAAVGRQVMVKGMRFFAGDGLGWLLVAAVVFTVAEVVVVPLRLPLGWDEITYMAQTSAHRSPVVMPPIHSRGPGLLAAPVTLLTTSIVILRAWMTLLSGAGLFLALLAWRRLRPGHVLAVAAVIVGSLAVTQLSAVQVMPDWWEAIGALAVTGLFLQAVTIGHTRLVAVLLAASVFFLVLVRWQDAVFLTAPLVAATLVVPAWRRRGALAAIAVGLTAGAAEWAGEAWAFYGGPVGRVRLTALEPPRFGLYFSLPRQVGSLAGGCSPGHCPPWVLPSLGAWWAVLLALAVLGIITARRTRSGAPVAVPADRAAAAVPAACAATLLAGYSLFDPGAADRYLLPVIALTAIPVADGITRFVAAYRRRAAALLTMAAFLLAGLVTQHYVLRAESARLSYSNSIWLAQANYLRHKGVRPPCILSGGHLPAAYYLGCASAWADQNLPALLARPPGPSGWHHWDVPSMRIRVYIRDKRSRPGLRPEAQAGLHSQRSWLPRSPSARRRAPDQQNSGRGWVRP